MTTKEFSNKYNLPLDIINYKFDLFSMLDYLYIAFTKEQLIEMISDYYDNADQIYNDLEKTVLEGSEFLGKLVDKKKK